MNKVHEVYDGLLIDSSRISVVIQGLTHYESGDSNCLFYRCVSSIKKHLPDAEIIVSTWKGQFCDESIVDIVIYNDEPESLITLHNKQWNYNKMIVSTIQGINSSTREYILKFRADLQLKGTSFFKITKKNSNNCLSKYRINNHLINITNLYIRKPNSYASLLFHLSDIVQFGHKVDMLNLWNRNILDPEDALFTQKKFKLCFFYPYLSNEKLVPEQALMVDWLRSNQILIDLKFPGFINFKYFKKSEIILSLNFSTFNWENSDIIFPKRFTENKKDLEKTLYSADYLNNVCEKKKNRFYFERKFIQILYIRYLGRFFIFEVWLCIIASILFFISPSLFFNIKNVWKKIKFLRFKVAN